MHGVMKSTAAAAAILGVCGLATGDDLAAGAGAGPATVWVQPYFDGDWVSNGYDPDALWTWRVYVDMFDENEQLQAVFGTAGGGAEMSMFSSPSGVFVNATTFDSLTSPIDLTGAGIWENQWDTYVTMGVDDAAGDDTSLSPGFGVEVGNLVGNFTSNQASWFVTSASDQGYESCDRILIAQLTTPAGSYPGGSANLFSETGQYHNFTFDYLGNPPCFGDVDHDGSVGISDLLAMLGQWGTCGDECINCNADLNRDGQVDVTDMLLILNRYGTFCWE